MKKKITLTISTVYIEALTMFDAKDENDAGKDAGDVGVKIPRRLLVFVVFEPELDEQDRLTDIYLPKLPGFFGTFFTVDEVHKLTVITAIRVTVCDPLTKDQTTHHIASGITKDRLTHILQGSQCRLEIIDNGTISIVFVECESARQLADLKIPENIYGKMWCPDQLRILDEDGEVMDKPLKNYENGWFCGRTIRFEILKQSC